ncbi:MAG TPA: hypothetical protein VGR16_05265 [Thermomicrobiales bacterium]|nr:hypothetical protein [Thermomicrobiales bacterium]
MSDRAKSDTSDEGQSAWDETKHDLASGLGNIKDRTEESVEELTRDHETTTEVFGVDDDDDRPPAGSRPPR